MGWTNCDSPHINRVSKKFNDHHLGLGIKIFDVFTTAIEDTSTLQLSSLQGSQCNCDQDLRSRFNPPQNSSTNNKWGRKQNYTKFPKNIDELKLLVSKTVLLTILFSVMYTIAWISSVWMCECTNPNEMD